MHVNKAGCLEAAAAAAAVQLQPPAMCVKVRFGAKVSGILCTEFAQVSRMAAVVVVADLESPRGGELQIGAHRNSRRRRRTETTVQWPHTQGVPQTVASFRACLSVWSSQLCSKMVAFSALSRPRAERQSKSCACTAVHFILRHRPQGVRIGRCTSSTAAAAAATATDKPKRQTSPTRITHKLT